MWCVASLVTHAVDSVASLSDRKVYSLSVVNVALLDRLVEDVLQDRIPSLDSSNLFWTLQCS